MPKPTITLTPGCGGKPMAISTQMRPQRSEDRPHLLRLLGCPIELSIRAKVFPSTHDPIRMVGGRFDLVIFDCDGVLVDSEPIINHAHAKVLSEYGYSITEEELLAR
jgi:hypothetical protein